MSTITLTVNLNDGQAIPLLEDLFSTMTVEDKRKLASQIAFNYFAGQLNDNRRDAYGRESPQVAYLKKLSDEVVGQIGKQIAEDPELSKLVQQVVSQASAKREQFVLQAVTNLLTRMLAAEANRTNHNEVQLFDTIGKVQMLESRVGIG